MLAICQASNGPRGVKAPAGAAIHAPSSRAKNPLRSRSIKSLWHTDDAVLLRCGRRRNHDRITPPGRDARSPKIVPGTKVARSLHLINIARLRVPRQLDTLWRDANLGANQLVRTSHQIKTRPRIEGGPYHQKSRAPIRRQGGMDLPADGRRVHPELDTMCATVAVEELAESALA